MFSTFIGEEIETKTCLFKQSVDEPEFKQSVEKPEFQPLSDVRPLTLCYASNQAFSPGYLTDRLNMSCPIPNAIS